MTVTTENHPLTVTHHRAALNAAIRSAGNSLDHGRDRDLNGGNLSMSILEARIDVCIRNPPGLAAIVKQNLRQTKDFLAQCTTYEELVKACELNAREMRQNDAPQSALTTGLDFQRAYLDSICKQLNIKQY